MHCCAHILNLIVQDGLVVIGDAIEKIRDNIVYWKANPKREQKFEETSRQLQIQSNKKLSLDCKSIWNSAYEMLHTTLIYKDVFYRLRQRESQYKCLPTEEEWELAKEICGRLKLFYNVIELFSRTKYPTTNLYVLKVCEIRIALSQWLRCLCKVVRKMALKMVEKFNKYWCVINGILGVAVVLDPRYKMKLMEYFFPMIYVDGALDEIERIRQLYYDLLHEYQFKSKYKEVGHGSETLVSPVYTSENINMEEQDPLSNYDLFINRSSSNLTVKLELDHYLEENVLPRTWNFDILVWWKSNGLKYPTLQTISRNVLTIPISTVASESTLALGEDKKCKREQFLESDDRSVVIEIQNKSKTSKAFVVDEHASEQQEHTGNFTEIQNNFTYQWLEM
ncbi:PREDICTED: zinc finger BED domain-containing protein RICESLEEPER 2-like [Nelumbo nucifera]|uniref:Zinc finger BED domain-containing protein RICESLEEPER 2-like n=1 Tax=Nelumbo nucifera TaxID=4432 RepID=A0A1U8AI34_NELNU|nr:PREDICTED: zinc finger BED domain-containing protein RICESLEEPER 2-like [Nelumbo nucifera]